MWVSIISSDLCQGCTYWCLTPLRCDFLFNSFERSELAHPNKWSQDFKGSFACLSENTASQTMKCIGNIDRQLLWTGSTCEVNLMIARTRKTGDNSRLLNIHIGFSRQQLREEYWTRTQSGSVPCSVDTKRGQRLWVCVIQSWIRNPWWKSQRYASQVSWVNLEYESIRIQQIARHSSLNFLNSHARLGYLHCPITTMTWRNKSGIVLEFNITKHSHLSTLPSQKWTTVFKNEVSKRTSSQRITWLTFPKGKHCSRTWFNPPVSSFGIP